MKPGWICSLCLAVPLHGATLTWDTVADGAPITHGSGTWNLAASPARWNDGAANLPWTNAPLKDAVFVGGASGATITLGSDAIAAAIITVKGAGNTILQGPLANLTATELRIQTVSDGKLVMNSGTSGTLSHIPAVSIAGGATLYLSGTIVDSAFTMTGSGNNEARGAVRLDSNGKIQGTLALAGSATFGSSSGTGIIASSISGPFAFNQAATSPGVIRLTGDSSYSGGTTISNGFVQAGHDHAFGTGTLALTGGSLSSDSTVARSFVNACTIGGVMALGDAANNGRLVFTGPVDLGSGSRTLNTASDVEFTTLLSGGPLVHAGSGKLILSGSFTAQSSTAALTGSAVTLGPAATIHTNGFDVTASAALEGSGGLAKTGTGTLSLTGAASFTGPIAVSAGTLRLLPGVGLPADLDVLPLGDSITYGYGGRDGYRGPLYAKVAGIAPGWRFVGDSTLVPAGPSALPALQTSHAGHSSYSSVDIEHNLDGLDSATYQLYGGAERDPHGGYWLTGGNGTGRAALFPDVVLLLAGTNDITRLPMASAEARYRALLTKLTTLRPAARIFTAKLTPLAANAAQVTQFNQIITNLAAEFQTAGKKVTLVDLFTNYPGGSFVDGVHPNEAGYQWMAERWYDVLTTTLGIPRPADLGTAASLTVASGAKLEGAAKLPALTIHGTLSPGIGTGTVEAGNTSIDGSYQCDLATAASDLLAVTGNLDINGATLQLSAAGALPPACKIASYSGSLSGSFATVTGLPAGRQVIYDAPRKAIFIANDYGAWALTAGLAESDLAAALDPDHDGQSNLLEYAVGGYPLDPADTGVYRPQPQAGTLTLVIATRAGASFTSGPDNTLIGSAGGIDYRVEASPNLADWNAPILEVLFPPDAELPPPRAGCEYHRFALAEPMAGGSRGFIRVKVVANP